MACLEGNFFGKLAKKAACSIGLCNRESGRERERESLLAQHSLQGLRSSGLGGAGWRSCDRSWRFKSLLSRFSAANRATYMNGAHSIDRRRPATAGLQPAPVHLRQLMENGGQFRATICMRSERRLPSCVALKIAALSLDYLVSLSLSLCLRRRQPVTRWQRIFGCRNGCCQS